MKQPQLGFNLWTRKCKSKIYKLTQKNLSTVLNIFLAALGITLTIYGTKLSIQSNTLSETALSLAQNDTSQQAQIRRLESILLEMQLQSALAKSQTQQLIQIDSATDETNKGNHKLISISNNQLSAFGKQLQFAIKNDSVMTNANMLANETDLLKLRQLLEEVTDINKIRMWSQLHKSQNPDLGVIQDYRITLEKGMSNKLVLTDTIIKKYWYSYYLLVKDAEFMTSLSAKNGGTVTSAQLQIILKKFEDKSFVFVNAMLQRLNSLESVFASKNYIQL